MRWNGAPRPEQRGLGGQHRGVLAGKIKRLQEAGVTLIQVMENAYARNCRAAPEHFVTRCPGMARAAGEVSGRET